MNNFVFLRYIQNKKKIENYFWLNPIDTQLLIILLHNENF